MCVWLWRASCGAAFRSWHGGHFRWRVLLIAALSCRPFTHHCAMSARDVRGFSVWVLCVLARSCVRAADMHDMCLWLFRASWCSSIGIARWSLRVASAADRCAELSPLSRITVPCRPEMSGASAFSLGTLCLVCSRVRAADTHDVCVWLWRARCGAAFRSWHGGHIRWPVLLTGGTACGRQRFHAVLHATRMIGQFRRYSISPFLFMLHRIKNSEGGCRACIVYSDVSMYSCIIAV